MAHANIEPLLRWTWSLLGIRQRPQQQSRTDMQPASPPVLEAAAPASDTATDKGSAPHTELPQSSSMEAPVKAAAPASNTSTDSHGATVLVDMDNTICDFDGEVVRRFTDKFPGQTMLTTSAATRRNWGIAEDVREPYSEEVKKIFRESGFAESLPPIAGAARALKEMLAEGYDVRLCTSPLVNQPMGVGEKFVWVAAVLGDEWKKRIIITSDKTMVKGLMLIDDKLAIVDEKSVCNPPEWKQYAACRLTRHHPFARKPTPFTLLFESPPIHSPVPTSPTRRFVATQSHLSKAVPRSLRGRAPEPYRARPLEGLAKGRRS